MDLETREHLETLGFVAPHRAAHAKNLRSGSEAKAWEPTPSMVRRYRPLVPAVSHFGGAVRCHPKVSPVALGVRSWPQEADGREAQLEAMAAALAAGMNLIDCGAGLASGAPSSHESQQVTAAFLESIVGQVLVTAAQTPSATQRDVCVVTRVGLVTAAESEQLTGTRDAAPSCFFGDDGLAFCLEPEVIGHQVKSSRERLFAAALKNSTTMVLHHYVMMEAPERLLVWALERGAEPAQAHAWLHERLADAFRTLGTLCRELGLGGFGISSEAFDLPHDSPCRIELETLVEIADAAGCREFLCLVSWPLNWIEATGITGHGDAGNTKTSVLDRAMDAGLGVLAHRPFNALSRGQLIRLARPRAQLLGAVPQEAELARALNTWASFVDDLERMAREVLDETGALGCFDDVPLQQLVLASLAEVRGVSAVVTSMRRAGDVAEACTAMTLPRLLDGRTVLRQIHDRLSFET